MSQCSSKHLFKTNDIQKQKTTQTHVVEKRMIQTFIITIYIYIHTLFKKKTNTSTITYHPPVTIFIGANHSQSWMVYGALFSPRHEPTCRCRKGCTTATKETTSPVLQGLGPVGVAVPASIRYEARKRNGMILRNARLRNKKETK